MADHRLDRGLEAALAERERLTERFHQAIGTELEESAYMRLRAAHARVAMQDRLADQRRRARPRRSR
jgi:hypothetical protein